MRRPNAALMIGVSAVLCAASFERVSAQTSAAAPQAAAAQDAPSRSPSGAVLVLNFSGLKSRDGAVMAAVFASPDAYRSGAAPVRAVKAPIADGTATIEISGLEPGRYAVKAFHDLNGDGVLQFNLFGVPTEPVAFSNNAKIKGGPPSWDETAFTAGPGRTSQDIVID